MSTFLQTLIVGLRLGSIYALVALGYTMVYGIIRLINFAHGDFIMVGGYTMIFTVPVVLALGLPAWTAVVAAIIVCALVGMGTEYIAYRPVRKKGTKMTSLITAIAMSLFLENLAQAIPAIGPNPKVASQIFAAGGISLGGITLEYTTLLTILIAAVVCAGLYLFTQKTKLGRAMRCVAEDKEAATILGVHVNRTILATFAPPWARCWDSRPLWRRCWAALAFCRAPCWAGSSLAWWSPSPPATSPPVWPIPSSF